MGVVEVHAYQSFRCAAKERPHIVDVSHIQVPQVASVAIGDIQHDPAWILIVLKELVGIEPARSTTPELPVARQ
jgi:hypothetical protein